MKDGNSNNHAQVWVVVEHGYERGDGDEVKAVVATELDGHRLMAEYDDSDTASSSYGTRGYTLEGPFPVQEDVKVSYPYLEEQAKKAVRVLP